MASILRQLTVRKRKIEQRLAQANRDKYRRAAEDAGPVLSSSGVKYELADKARGIAYSRVARTAAGTARQSQTADHPSPRLSAPGTQERGSGGGASISRPLAAGPIG